MTANNTLKTNTETFEPLEHVFERSKLYHLSLEKDYFELSKQLKNQPNILDYWVFKIRYFYYKYIFQNNIIKLLVFIFVLCSIFITITTVNFSLNKQNKMVVNEVKGVYNTSYNKQSQVGQSINSSFKNSLVLSSANSSSPTIESSINNKITLTSSASSISSINLSSQQSSQVQSSLSSSSVIAQPKTVLGLQGYGCKYSWLSVSDPLQTGQTQKCFLIDATNNIQLATIRDCKSFGAILGLDCLFFSRVYLANMVGDEQQIIEIGNLSYALSDLSVKKFSNPVSPQAGAIPILDSLRIHFYNTKTKELTKTANYYLVKNYYPTNSCDLRSPYSYKDFSCFADYENHFTLQQIYDKNIEYFSIYDTYVPKNLILN